MVSSKKIVVFASGSGTNFINIYQNVNNGNVVLLISNNPESGAVKYAIENNIDYKVINDFRYPGIINIEYENTLKKYNPDLILLAGFMKKIPDNVIRLYENKIINIHPSLLPKYGGKGYYGIKVHESVINSKDKVTGATIHFINNEYDRGPIIMQKKVCVNDDDSPISLSKRVLKIEYDLYLKVVQLFCDNKIQVDKNKVIINE